MTIKQYLAELEDVEASFKDEIEAYAYKRGTIMRSVKSRLFRGFDGNLKSLGEYAPSTKKRKRRKGQKSSNVTLRYTGGWYNDLFLVWESGELILDNKDDFLTNKLIDGEKWFTGYGDAILELSEDDIEIFNALVDEYIASVEKRLNKDLELEF